MRFLVLTQYFPPEIGAPQVRLASMIRELVRLGHEVEVVAALPNHPLGRIFPGYRGRVLHEEAWEGVPVHRVWLYSSTGAGLKRMLNYASFTLTCLLGLIRSKRPDYVFVESPPLFLSVPAYLACRAWRARMIFNVADLWPDSVRELGIMGDGAIMRFAERLEHWSYNASTYVNAVTEGIAKTIIEKKHVPPRKVLFLPNGVDVERFKPLSPDHELVEQLGLGGRKIILYAGTVGFAQGLDVALEAMHLLQSTVPEAVLVLLGDGSDKARLVAMARQRNMQNVVFLEPRPPTEVPRFYSISLAGLATLKNLPLFEGARPSKVFPIMACGKPVLYSGSGEGARLVDKARGGLVVRPEDPVALAEAIRMLCADSTLACTLGQSGRDYAVEHLSWSGLVHEWLKQLG